MDSFGVFTRGLTTTPAFGAINLHSSFSSPFSSPFTTSPCSDPSLSTAQKIDKLEAERNRISNALFSNRGIRPSEAEFFSQQCKLLDFDHQLKGLKVELAEEKERCAALEETVKELGEAKAAVEEERDRFESALGVAEQQVAVAEEQKEDLAARVDVSERRVEVVEVANKELTATLDAVQKETAELKAQKVTIVDCLLKIAEKANDLADERNVLRTEVGTVTAKHEELFKIASSHEKAAKNHLKAARVAQNKICFISSSLRVAQAKTEKVEKDRKQLRAELDEEKTSHANDVATLSADNARLAESLADKKAQVEELTTGCEGLRVKLEAEREAVSTVTLERTELSACLSKSEALSSQHDSEIASLFTSLDEEKKKTRDLQRSQAISRRQAAHLSSKCSRLSSTMVDLRREKAALESDLGHEVEDNGLLRDIIDPLQHEASQLRESMQEALVQRTAMEAQHETDVAVLNQTLLDAQATHNADRLALEKKLADFEAQLASERQRAASAEAEVEAEKQKSVELERQVRVAQEEAAVEKEGWLQVEEEHRDLWAQLQAEQEAHRLTQQKNVELERQLRSAQEEAAAERESWLQVEEEHDALWAQLQAEREAHGRTQEDLEIMTSRLKEEKRSPVKAQLEAQLKTEQEARRHAEEDLEVFTLRLKEEKRSADVLRRKQDVLIDEGRRLYQRVAVLQGIVNHYQDESDSSDEDEELEELEDTTMEDTIARVAPEALDRDAIYEVLDAVKSDADGFQLPAAAVSGA